MDSKEEMKMDIDALLLPTKNTDNQIIALMAIVRANTSAIKEIRVDLATCDNVDKVRAVIAKAEQALEDLSMDSQKIDAWIKAEPKDDDAVTKRPYGQYPVYQPLNRDNPVPWPPDYVSPQMEQQQKLAEEQAAVQKVHAEAPKPRHETTGDKK